MSDAMKDLPFDDPLFEAKLMRAFDAPLPLDDGDAFAARLEGRFVRRALRRRIALVVSMLAGGGVASLALVRSHALALVAQEGAWLQQAGGRLAQAVTAAEPQGLASSGQLGWCLLATGVALCALAASRIERV